MCSFFEKVYNVVMRIPRGKVLAYGDVARMAGSPHSLRQVGWALHCNPEPGVIPCHRVVFKSGKVTEGFAFGGADVQRAMLENEGVVFGENGAIDMRKFEWRGE